MMLKLTEDRRKVGGIALGGIWIGCSKAQASGDLASNDIGAVLNVAQDLVSVRAWPSIEAMQVGLTDGPGNEPVAYIAAVLALHALLRRHNVLVCCHTGGRALAIATMYICATSGLGWSICLAALEERVGDLPLINPIHKEAIAPLLGGAWRNLL